MTTQQLLIEQIRKVPEPIAKEVYDFLRFLLSKAVDESFDGLRLSESALAKDWMAPEEDEVWKDL